METFDLQPNEIIKRIDRSPVYLRGETEGGYVGVRVRDWKVRLVSIHKRKNGFVRLMLLAGHLFPWVYAEVKLSKYPRLKVMQEKEKLVVSGTIRKVSGHNIELEDPIIKFKTRTKKHRAAPRIIIRDSQFHLGGGDNVGGDKKMVEGKKETFVEKFFWYAVVALVVAVFAQLIWSKLGLWV